MIAASPSTARPTAPTITHNARKGESSECFKLANGGLPRAQGSGATRA